MHLPILIMISQLLHRRASIVYIRRNLERLKDGHTIERKFFSPYATILSENFIKSEIDASLQYLTLAFTLPGR
jgi:hypothetical protein